MTANEQRLAALAAMADGDAENCIRVLLKGLVETAPRDDFRKAITNESAVVRSLRDLAAECGQPAAFPTEPAAGLDRTRAVRALLIEFAVNDDLARSLDDALTNTRQKLVEPIATALVLTGIVFVLSLEIDAEAKTVDGKTEWSLRVKKRPTADKVLAKFWGLFA
jgi:hypothetical protein